MRVQKLTKIGGTKFCYDLVASNTINITVILRVTTTMLPLEPETWRRSRGSLSEIEMKFANEKASLSEFNEVNILISVRIP